MSSFEIIIKCQKILRSNHRVQVKNVAENENL